MVSAKRRGYLRLGLKMANFGPPLHNGGHFHMLNYLPQAIDLFVVYSPWSRYPLEMETREAKWLSIMVQSMSTPYVTSEAQFALERIEFKLMVTASHPE